MSCRQLFLSVVVCAVVTFAFADSAFSDEPQWDGKTTLNEAVRYFFGDVYGSDKIEKPANPFDFSLLDVPEGENVMFYSQRIRDIMNSLVAYSAAIRKNPDIKVPELDDLVRAATERCSAYMTLASDFDRSQSWAEQTYYRGLAYFGKVDELTKELNAEFDKETPDQSKTITIRNDLAIAETSRAIQENRFDSFLDETIKNGLASDDVPNMVVRLVILGRFDLLDMTEYRMAKAFLKSRSQKFVSYARMLGDKHRDNCVGKELKLEGVFTDGTEFSWEDYRGKAVLVYCIPRSALSKKYDQSDNLLAAYRAYRDFGLEVVCYAFDDEKTNQRSVATEDLPGKIISQKATRAAKDKNYLDFSVYYHASSEPAAYLVGKDGKVVATNIYNNGYLASPAREYPDAAGAEIERRLNALGEKDRDLKSKRVDLGAAVDLFKTFNPTKDEIDAFMKRVEETVEKTGEDLASFLRSSVDEEEKPTIVNELNKGDIPTTNPFDYSLFDIPEGKDVAFYKQRKHDLSSSFSAYSMAALRNDEIKDLDLGDRMRPAYTRCEAYMTLSPDFDRHESPENERYYYQGQAYFGNVDLLVQELDAELDKDQPDQDKAHMLRQYITLAETSKALSEGKLDELIDAKLEKVLVKDSPMNRFELYSVAAAVETLGRFDLLDMAEYRIDKGLQKSLALELNPYVTVYGSKHVNKCVGKDLRLEGVFTDGTEFSWDDYRGKVVLVYLIPPYPVAKGFDQTKYILSAYNAFHDSGFEVVGYALDDVEYKVVSDDGSKPQETQSMEEKLKELPWKVVSRKATLAAKDKNYLDFATFYSVNGYPHQIFVGKDGKVARTHVRDEFIGGFLAKEYPDAARAEIDRLLDVPDDQDMEYYNRF
ncbi:MAG: redoxin domain-containing protein, partial [Thermoguttaceae bacterium]|nr:redoxin domain-containing protein [Thermoguttaceae bacterium]